MGVPPQVAALLAEIERPLKCRVLGLGFYGLGLEALGFCKTFWFEEVCWASAPLLNAFLRVQDRDLQFGLGLGWWLDEK